MRSHSILGICSILLRLIARAEIRNVVERQSSFLRITGTVLRELYFNRQYQEHVPAALRLMKQVQLLIRRSTPGAAVDVLITLSEGLSVWIGDENELLLEQEHNDIVRDAQKKVPRQALTVSTCRLFHYIEMPSTPSKRYP